MKRVAVAASFLAITCLAVPALAGGYVGLGLGSDAELSGDIATSFSADGTSNGRFLIGQRTGPIAIEASIFGTDLVELGTYADYSTLAVGVDLKYYLTLSGPIEGYGRFGLNKTWLVADLENEQGLELSGRGMNIGAGLQYSFRLLPLGEVAIWLDYTHQSMNLNEDVSATSPASGSTTRSSLDGAAEMLTVGVLVGF